MTLILKQRGRVVRAPNLKIWRSRVQVPLRPLARFVRGSPWFNSWAALVQSQLVCLLPVGILNLSSSFQLFVSLARKSPNREWSIKYVKHFAPPLTLTRLRFCPVIVMWTADIQMKWRCDHRSCDCDLSNPKLSPKSVFGASTGFEPMAS